MTPCTERLIAWTLIVVGLVALIGFNKLPLLLILIPFSLLLACILAPAQWSNRADSGLQKR